MTNDTTKAAEEYAYNASPDGELGMPIYSKRNIVDAYLSGHAFASAWIEVTPDTIPDANQQVLALHRYGRMSQQDWEAYTNKDRNWFLETFTHWMPLPTPPNK